LSDKKIWFGQRGFMRWVPAPRVDMPSSKVGFTTKMNFLGGGARTRMSYAGHKVYVMSWTMKPRDEVRPVMDYANGMFGDGHVYFSDPFAMDKNVLSDVWAAPYLSAKGGIILDNSNIEPQLIPTDANPYGFPAYSAVFDVPAIAPGEPRYEFFVPIPPGHTAWFGAHGAAGTGGVVEVLPALGATAVGAATPLALLTTTGSTRFNHSVSSDEGIGAIVRLGGVGTITLAGLMVQVLPTGKTPTDTDFISGQGSTGLRFEEVEYNPYSAALDKVSLTVQLNEDEAWSFVPNILGA
jgi:hypothetical protein